LYHLSTVPGTGTGYRHEQNAHPQDLQGRRYLAPNQSLGDTLDTFEQNSEKKGRASCRLSVYPPIQKRKELITKRPRTRTCRTPAITLVDETGGGKKREACTCTTAKIESDEGAYERGLLRSGVRFMITEWNNRGTVLFSVNHGDAVD